MVPLTYPPPISVPPQYSMIGRSLPGTSERGSRPGWSFTGGTERLDAADRRRLLHASAVPPRLDEAWYHPEHVDSVFLYETRRIRGRLAHRSRASDRRAIEQGSRRSATAPSSIRYWSATRPPRRRECRDGIGVHCALEARGVRPWNRFRIAGCARREENIGDVVRIARNGFERVVINEKFAPCDLPCAAGGSAVLIGDDDGGQIRSLADFFVHRDVRPPRETTSTVMTAFASAIRAGARSHPGRNCRRWRRPRNPRGRFPGRPRRFDGHGHVERDARFRIESVVAEPVGDTVDHGVEFAVGQEAVGLDTFSTLDDGGGAAVGEKAGVCDVQPGVRKPGGIRRTILEIKNRGRFTVEGGCRSRSMTVRQKSARWPIDHWKNVS